MVAQTLAELRQTRVAFQEANDTFSKAVSSIKWNRFNTVIQYILSAVIICMLGFGARWYVADLHLTCLERNELRAAIVTGNHEQAKAIGLAIVSVTGADHTAFQAYMDAYEMQPTPLALAFEEC